MKFCLAVLAVMAPSAVRADVAKASFLERALVLPEHVVQIHTAYDLRFDNVGTTVHQVLLGFEVGVPGGLQLGLSVVQRVTPNLGFDRLAVRAAYLAHDQIAVRVDGGVYDTKVYGQTPGFSGGMGVSLRIPLISDLIVLTSGRFTGLPPIGPRFSPWPSFSFADDLITVDVNALGPTGSVGVPIGVLMQLAPGVAAGLRVGYRHTFGAYATADYVPVGVDLLASGAIDVIVSAEMPRKLQSAAAVYEGRVLLQARF